MRPPDINENPLGVIFRLMSQLFWVYVWITVVWLAIVLVVNVPWLLLIIIPLLLLRLALLYK